MNEQRTHYGTCSTGCPAGCPCWCHSRLSRQVYYDTVRSITEDPDVLTAVARAEAATATPASTADVTSEARPLTRTAWDARLTFLLSEHEHAVDHLEAVEAEIRRTLVAPHIPDPRKPHD